MEFNEYFNPGTIFMSILLVLAVLGYIGNKLTENDKKSEEGSENQ